MNRQHRLTLPAVDHKAKNADDAARPLLTLADKCNSAFPQIEADPLTVLLFFQPTTEHLEQKPLSK